MNGVGTTILDQTRLLGYKYPTGHCAERRTSRILEGWSLTLTSHVPRAISHDGRTGMCSCNALAAAGTPHIDGYRACVPMVSCVVASTVLHATEQLPTQVAK